MSVVLLELVGVPRTKDYVAVVTLNRPAAKNALNKELSVELARTLGELRSRDDIIVCIVIGSGHCFCAGTSNILFQERTRQLVQQQSVTMCILVSVVEKLHVLYVFSTISSCF